VTDPRLEGGNFYQGSHSLEQQLLDVIQETKDYLGFSDKDVIYSGLSMGTLGAMHYGFQAPPYAIILGKPIADLSYVAQRTPLVRPNEFLTIFDMVKYWHKTDQQGQEIPIEQFNHDFFQAWEQSRSLEKTTILLAHMEDDDYDDKAYYRLLEANKGKDTIIIARGYPGRHNDQSEAITTWFVHQYQRMIAEYVDSKK